MALFKDMTAAERQAAYNEAAEAVEVHVTCFALRPVRGRPNQHDIAAMRHADSQEQKMRLIRNVARKLGDTWVGA